MVGESWWSQSKVNHHFFPIGLEINSFSILGYIFYHHWSLKSTKINHIKLRIRILQGKYKYVRSEEFFTLFSNGFINLWKKKLWTGSVLVDDWFFKSIFKWSTIGKPIIFFKLSIISIFRSVIHQLKWLIIKLGMIEITSESI